MEILIGLVLLLQVFASIQLMHTRRQMLHQINTQSKKMDDVLEAMCEKANHSEKDMPDNEHDTVQNMGSEPLKKESEINTKQKEEREALINEVLSEVFP